FTYPGASFTYPGESSAHPGGSTASTNLPSSLSDSIIHMYKMGGMRLRPFPAVLLLSALTAAPALAGPSVQVRMVFQAHGTEAQAEAAAQVLRERLDQLGADDPEVTVQGDRISVRAGDVDDVQRLRQLLLSRAKLGLQF